MIFSQADYLIAVTPIRETIDQGDYARAVAEAEGLSGDGFLVLQAVAYTYAEAGSAAGDLELLQKAIGTWQTLCDGNNVAELTFNAANSHIAYFETVVRSKGYLFALEAERAHLFKARKLFRLVAEDGDTSVELRVQANTNVGNSFDLMGRDVDALEFYERAITLDPKFGMALGNKGITLLGIVPLVDEHRQRILGEAHDALEHAAEDEQRVRMIGGEPALASFQAARDRIVVRKTRPDAGSNDGTVSGWSDPYLIWCRDEGLFLHVSPDCLVDEESIVDPLFFSGVLVGLSDVEQRRLTVLVDAFNTIKQDYIAARYLTWLASHRESSIRMHASTLSGQSKFGDSLTYARWGIRTGLGIQAFTAAVNLLDKLASFTHLYLASGVRVRDVYFSTLWRRRSKPTKMDTVLAEELLMGNRGLLALCDLSCELEQSSRLGALHQHRHTATHRFLVAHDLSVDESRAAVGEWLDRVEWPELVTMLSMQLRIARSGIIYLARMIQIRERRRSSELDDEGAWVPPLPMQNALTEHPDLD